MKVVNSLRQKLLRWLLMALVLLVAVGIVTDYFMALELRAKSMISTC